MKPDGLAWFTKPEIAIKQRVKDHYRNEKEKEHRKVLEHVDVVRGKHALQVGYIIDQINSCLDVLNTTNHQNEDGIELDDDSHHVTPKPPDDKSEGGITVEPDSNKNDLKRKNT